MTKYKKITIDHAIYIKLFYDGTVSYPMVSIYDVLNITHNETVFTKVRRVLKKIFILKSKKYIYIYITVLHVPKSYP